MAQKNPHSKKKIGIAIGLIIVPFVAVVAGLYFERGTLQNLISVINPTPTPTPIPRVVLQVSSYISDSYWTRNSVTDLPDYVNTIVCSVTNTGNAPASNVNLEIKVDGAVYETKFFSSLAIGTVETYSFSLTVPYDSSRNLLMHASCSDSDDSASISVKATLPRSFDENLAKLYITPNEPTLVTLKNQILKEKFILTPNWIALRDWVSNNVKYKYDSDVHGEEDYWQLPKETIQLRTGDCEDYAILLCSLLRADGWSSNSVYVIVGEQNNNYHVWVKIIWSGIEYGIEPQQNGWSTLIGDYLSLSGYEAKYAFNDVTFGSLR
jgi:hypothetical protein